MIDKFDFLLFDGGNLVLYDNLNILSITLLIFLSVIVFNKKDISRILAPKITTIYFDTL